MRFFGWFIESYASEQGYEYDQIKDIFFHSKKEAIRVERMAQIKCFGNLF